jgi:hypothetical protein
MLRKFKIGEIVRYRPAERRHREADGVYIVTSLLPGDGQPQYRIKHPSEEFERVAMEGELSTSESEHGQR